MKNKSATRRLVRAGAATLIAATLMTAALPPALAQSVAEADAAGKLANGTKYAMHRPANWNGVLVLNPDLRSERDAALEKRLYALGYATASRARDVTNWQVRDGASDLVQLKALFAQAYGAPKRTIVIGGSLGGLVTRDAGETYPQHFDGLIPSCGGGAGLIAMYNNRLDVAFAVKALLAADDAAVEVDHIRDDRANAAATKAAVERALKTPEGRARIALIGAIGQLSGWPMNAPRPTDNDYDTQLKVIGEAAAGILNLKSDVEKAAGGSFSWNVGVDYVAMFRAAGPAAVAMTETLYREAGADLQADLDRLEKAPRRQADAEALAWARANGTPSGRLQRPTLAMFTGADPRAPLSEFRAYQTVVDKAGASALLRQAGVDRSGHCNFTGAERLAAILTLDERLRTGRWPATTPAALNARAEVERAKAPDLGQPRFADFTGAPTYPRQFNFDDRAPPAAIKTN